MRFQAISRGPRQRHTETSAASLAR